jgi:hypothetical protein
MELIAVTQTIRHIHEKNLELTLPDREFVAQFVFRTGDLELTNKLIEELIQPDADRNRIRQKFETMVDLPSDWMQKLEELLIALILYRIQEEKAVMLLNGLLSDCPIHMTEERKNHATMEREENERKKEKEEEFIEEETYVRRDTTGNTDYPSRL